MQRRGVTTRNLNWYFIYYAQMPGQIHTTKYTNNAINDWAIVYILCSFLRLILNYVLSWALNYWTPNN